MKGLGKSRHSGEVGRPAKHTSYRAIKQIQLQTGLMAQEYACHWVIRAVLMADAASRAWVVLVHEGSSQAALKRIVGECDPSTQEIIIVLDWK